MNKLRFWFESASIYKKNDEDNRFFQRHFLNGFSIHE